MTATTKLDPMRNVYPSGLTEHLKSSKFIVGAFRACRGLQQDIRTLGWIAKRQSRIADYLRRNTTKRLQLGASNNLLEGWLNTDIHPERDSVLYLDATKRFPFDDNTFHYIISEHMIEHIDYRSGDFMLRECFRVLRPGGRIRIATPSLSVIVALHGKTKTSDQSFYLNWALARFLPDVRHSADVFVINNFFRAWGHQFLYDPATLSELLVDCGFEDVVFHKPGKSDDPELRGLESHGKEIGSEDINQFETMVAEAIKR